MKKETRIKVCYPNYYRGEDYHGDQQISSLSRIVKDSESLFRIFKMCYNNRIITHIKDVHKSLFQLDQLKFDECIGGVCDMGHFHVEEYKVIEKPKFYDEAVKMLNVWIAECEKKHIEYLEAKKTEEDKEKEEEEHREYLRLKEKFGDKK